MRILVVGSGGREHALVWKLSQSRLVKKIFSARGNGGISEIAECLPLGVDKPVELADFAISSKIDLTVVGPEVPLVHGMVDYFREREIPIFGPTKAAARLEGSKAFAKDLMERCGVPTARYRLFGDFQSAADHLEEASIPVVVKADGLASGKGAIVAQSKEEALQAARGILKDRIFGEAGSQVVIEDFLQGEEASILAFSDGKHLALLEPSQDHKQAFDGDQGPNTGGMGAYSPVPQIKPKVLEEIRAKVFEPVIRVLADQGTPFQGVLYAGLMLTPKGPKVLEFNVRFGDPEAQALLPRLQSDLAELMLSVLEGRLDRIPLQWDSKVSACVVLASGGYPTRYDLGREITGLKEVLDFPDTLIFQAGTKKEGNRLLTNGGRVLSVVGLGETLESALGKAYLAADKIQFEGKQFRRDIGTHALRVAR